MRRRRCSPPQPTRSRTRCWSPWRSRRRSRHPHPTPTLATAPRQTRAGPAALGFQALGFQARLPPTLAPGPRARARRRPGGGTLCSSLARTSSSDSPSPPTTPQPRAAQCRGGCGNWEAARRRGRWPSSQHRVGTRAHRSLSLRRANCIRCAPWSRPTQRQGRTGPRRRPSRPALRRAAAAAAPSRACAPSSQASPPCRAARDLRPSSARPSSRRRSMSSPSTLPTLPPPPPRRPPLPPWPERARGMRARSTWRRGGKRATLTSGSRRWRTCLRTCYRR